jgi:hypothetical protein
LFSQESAEIDDYQKAVSTILSRCTATEQSASFNQALLPYFKSFLGDKTVEIDFNVTKEKDGTKETLGNGRVVFDKGKLFIRTVTKEPSGRNYISQNNKLYSWTTGSIIGEILSPSEQSIVDYLVYFLDPSSFMRSFYFGFVTKDARIESRKIAESRLLLNTIPTSAFSAEIETEPLWLSAIIVSNYREDGVVIRSEFAYPKVIESVPEEMKLIPPEIKWKESTEDLRDRMSYM